MYDDVARRRVAVPYHFVARNRFAALRYLELRFRRRRFRIGFVRVGFVPLVFGFRRDEQGPELEFLAFGVYLEYFFQVVERDDSRADFAVKFFLVVAAVDGDYLLQYPAAEVDIQRFHLLAEQLHPSFDVVLPFAFQKALDGLFGFARRHRFQPFGFGACIVGRDDFYLVAVVYLRGDGFELVVDFGADGAVPYLGVDVVGEVQRGRSVWHFPRFSFRCKYCDFRCI